MKERLRQALMLLYRWLPKRNHAVFWAWPDLEDQSRALLPHLARSERLSAVYLLASEPEKVAPHFRDLHGKINVLPARSLRAAFFFLTARYTFFTHRYLAFSFPPTVTAVNLWHGMPIKRIGRMLEGSPVIVSTHTAVTSPFWAEIMQNAMPCTAAPLAVGLPRNDRFFLPRPPVLEKMGLSGRSDIRKVVAWLPTYRSSALGEQRSDGVESHSAFGMAGIDAEKLNAFCRERGLFLWLKPHPMALPASSVSHSHLVILSDEALAERQLSLYELLGASDLLISDISSVYVDYLILNRPIIHAFADRSAYGENRGFSVEPLEDYLAGPIVSNPEELYAALDTFSDGNDSYRPRREKLRDLFHTHPDGHASERLVASLGLERSQG